MKTSRWMAAALAAAAMGAQAQALQMPKETPWSVEFGYLYLKASAEGGSIDANLGRAVVGYRVNPALEIEGMLGMSLDATKFGSAGDVRVTQSVGLFIKPGVDLAPGWRAYARVGSLNSRLELESTAGDKASASKSTTAYGVGLSYKLNDQWSVVGDYMRYGQVEGITVNGATVGMAYRF